MKGEGASQGGFVASIPVRSRRVVVATDVLDLSDDSLVGAYVATVLELQSAGALVVVAGGEQPPTVQDLVARGLVEQATEFSEALLADAYLVVGVGDSERTERLAERAGSFCVRLPNLAAQQAGEMAKVGQVTLVGGGPGAAGLLTRDGQDALRSADVVIFDRLAPVSAIRALAPKATLVDVAKVPRGPGTSQERINELLIGHAQEGKNVVRLKGGDPYVFGRGGEEVLACADAGVTTSVVPGVSSALSVPALAGIPLTHRGVSQGFSVISGHLPPDHPLCQVDAAALARSGTTLVLLMAVATLPEYCAALVAAGLDPATPSATIADGSLAGQQVVRAQLADLPAAVKAAGVGAPAVTVIGPVVGLDLPAADPSAKPGS